MRRAASAAMCRRRPRISGSPAFDASEWLRAITAFQKLPEMLRTVRELKRKSHVENRNEPTKLTTASALAYQNEEFLNGPDARPLRILSEYLEPLSHFRRQRIRDTVVFFGSARHSGRWSAGPVL